MVLGAIVIVIVGILIVNYFKDKGGNGTITETSSQTNAVASNEHVVVKGETLWSIAEDSFGSGYNWVDIKSVNSLKTETIEVGQKLTIPSVSPKEPTSTKKVATISAGQTISGSTSDDPRSCKEKQRNFMEGEACFRYPAQTFWRFPEEECRDRAQSFRDPGEELSFSDRSGAFQDGITARRLERPDGKFLSRRPPVYSGRCA